MPTTVTQKEGQCAADIADAVTMYGFAQLMKLRDEWLPILGEEGWNRAFDRCSEALLEEHSDSLELKDIKDGSVTEKESSKQGGL